MLTRKQQELLRFIEARLDADGVSPSFEEMKAALDLKSKSGIHRLITALEERGFIRRLPHRARALEVLKRADPAPGAAPSAAGDPPPPLMRAGFTPNVIPGNFPTPPPPPPPGATSDVVALPLYGRIAAGTPIEALRGHNEHVEVPATMVTGGEHYALSVAGDSMVDAGIHDGDTVIIQRCENAENGSGASGRRETGS
ncbi:MAG: transcriptional repressor LexA, partial [Thalassobaculaceae bacterium]